RGTLRPFSLVVRIDFRRGGFCHGQPHADVRIHVAVGYVVPHLADRPAVRSITPFKLRIAQWFDQGPDLGGRAFNGVDQFRSLGRSKRALASLKTADGILLVFQAAHDTSYPRSVIDAYESFLK